MAKSKKRSHKQNKPLVTFGSGGIEGFNKLIGTLDLSNAVFVGTDADDDIDDEDPEEEQENAQRKTAFPQASPCKPL